MQKLVTWSEENADVGGQAEETSGQKGNRRRTGAREKDIIQGVTDLSVNQLRFILFKRIYAV